MTNAFDSDNDDPIKSTQSSVPTVPGQMPTVPDRADDAMPHAAFPEYEFLRELGRGGMGVVYLARNRLLDRLEAIKIVTRSWSENQFRQEVRAAAHLNHPNVVTVYTALPGTALAFAMEYVEGENLARVVYSHGPLSPARACAYARQVALGLEHAHERGMIHRDIKPQNLMVVRAGGREVIKILDFGLAKMANASGDERAACNYGQLLGTPGYASPEQVRDASTADGRSDIYSLGATLQFLLSGSHPTGDPLRDSNTVPSSCSRGLTRVLARMTAPNPIKRYQTAAEVAAALEPFTRFERRPSAPASPLRTKIGWRLVGTAVVLLTAALGAVSLRSPNGDPVEAPANAAERPNGNEFVRIFNGTDMSGWVVDGDGSQWRVEDGALVTTGTKAGPKTWLLSQRDYSDVRVRFEYQLEPGGNSGFAFRAVPGERPVLVPGGAPTPTTYHQQVELSDDSDKEWQWLPTGQVNGGSGRTAPALKPTRPARLRPTGEWNAVEIEMMGQSLKVTLNGDVIQAADLNQLVAQGSLYPALKRSHGRIAFQQLRKTARFRNVEILDLAK